MDTILSTLLNKRYYLISSNFFEFKFPCNFFFIFFQIIQIRCVQNNTGMNVQWASLCNAFLVEAKWLRSKNLPGAKEYLTNGKVSSGVYVVLVHLFFLLGYSGTNLDDVSPLISSVATILRLWDDLGTAQVWHHPLRPVLLDVSTPAG